MSDDSLSDLFTCIAFDPGGTTGWGLVSCYPEAINEPGYKILDNIVFWACGQFSGPHCIQANDMMDLVAAWPRSSAIVMEDFLLRQFRMDRTLLDPIRVMERFDQLLYNWDLEYLENVRRARDGSIAIDGPAQTRQSFKQQPAMAMTTMTDARLKNIEDAAAAAINVVAGGGAAAALRGTKVPSFYTATAGRPHARDAIRHVLTFMRRERAARLERPSHSLYLPGWTPPSRRAVA